MAKVAAAGAISILDRAVELRRRWAGGEFLRQSKRTIQ